MKLLRGKFGALLNATIHKIIINTVICLMMTVLLGRSIESRGLFYFDDYQSQFVPAYIDMGRSLDAGEYPLQSPYSWVGGALAGEYQYGVFNVPHLAIVYGLYKLDLAPILFAKYFMLIYYFILCLGIATLADSYALSVTGKILAVIIGSMNYFVLFWCGFDWIAGFSSFAWLPWCWAALQKQASKKSLVYVLPAGVVIALLLTAGYPFTVGMLLLVMAWLFVKSLRSDGLSAGLRMVFSGALGAGLAMPALLMLVAYYRHSARLDAAGGVSAVWSVPLGAFWGLLNPSAVATWNVWGELRTRFSFEVFGGLVPPVALLALACRRSLRRRVRLGFELLLLAVVVALMVAPAGTASYRWSFRLLPLYALVMAIIAARTCDAISAIPHKYQTIDVFGCRMCAVMVCGFASATIFVLQHIVLWPSQLTQSQYFYFIFIVACLFLWSFALQRKRKFRTTVRLIPVVLSSIALVLVYILPLNPRVVAKWYTLDMLRTSDLHFDPAVRYVSLFTQKDFFVQDSVTSLLPGNTPMLVGVHFLNGYSPMMLDEEFRLFRFEYSGSMKSENIDTLLSKAFAQDGMLDLFGIDGVAFGYSMMAHAENVKRQGWEVVSATPSGVVLHRIRKNNLPHAESTLAAAYGASDEAVTHMLLDAPNGERRHILLAEKGCLLPVDGTFTPISIRHIVEKRNTFSADILNNSGETPGLVVFKRAWYPGYRAFLDNEELPVLHADMLLPAVVIPPGRGGRLLLVYDPLPLRIGMAVTAGSLLVAFLVVFLHARRRRAQVG